MAGQKAITEAAHQARETIRTACTELELSWQEQRPGLFSVDLPGTRKLTTSCVLDVNNHAVGVRAFVARHPDENEAVVHRWLLEMNLRLRQVAFAVDHLGDIYLAGRLPVAGLTVTEVDQVLGTVADTADSSFNVILEMGFASGIAAEWAWRRSRGESTANLAAFAHLDPTPKDER